jgi:hypothetical protein
VSTHVKRTILGGAALAAMAVLAVGAGPGYAFAQPPAGQAVTGTATISGTTLTLATPAPVQFVATLQGIHQLVTAPQALDVMDRTGSGFGWNVSLTTTTFTTSGLDSPVRVLADNSVSDLGASGACDVSEDCVLADNLAGSVVNIPAADTAPDPVVILSAGSDTGMSDQTWTHSMQLALPGDAHAGNYSSTWTYTVGSAV